MSEQAGTNQVGGAGPLGGPPRYDHQKEGLKRLVRSGGRHALLWDPGTGKTRTVIDYCSLLARAKGDQGARVLVLAPLAAVDTWLSQAQTYLEKGTWLYGEVVGGTREQRAEVIAARGPGSSDPGLGATRAQMVVSRPETGLSRLKSAGPSSLPPGRRLTLLVANYDLFSSRALAKGKRSVTVADRVKRAVETYQPDLLVLDESHKIKGVSSNVGRLVRRVAATCPRVVLMTGTVMPLGPQDVWGQWQALDPQSLAVTHPVTGQPTTAAGAFEERYVQRDVRSLRIMGFKNLDELRQRMGARAHVVRKADALDLPPTTDVTVPVVLGQREAVAYQQMRKQMVALVGGGLITASNVLVKTLRLRQITSGHATDDSGQVQSLGSAKRDVAVSLVQDTLVGESRVVVFTFFRPEQASFVQALRARAGKGTEVMVISGDTPADERMKLRQRFGSDDPRRMVMVAQVETLNLAVNELVTACNAVFLTLPSRRDSYEQARARLDRVGQTRPVTFWHVEVPQSTDEVVLTSHRMKTSVERAVLDHLRQ